MRTVVSFLLGAVLLFGAATLGLQTGSANALEQQNKPANTQPVKKTMHTRTRHHRHRRHYRHRKHQHKLSY